MTPSVAVSEPAWPAPPSVGRWGAAMVTGWAIEKGPVSAWTLVTRWDSGWGVGLDLDSGQTSATRSGGGLGVGSVPTWASWSGSPLVMDSGSGLDSVSVLLWETS